MTSSTRFDYDVIVLGAGGAGLMCAGVAGRRGRSVLLLEQGRSPGEKIRISGGGRCNFTNLHTGPGNFLSQNPHFCKSALRGFTQHDFIALVEKHGIAYHEKTSDHDDIGSNRSDVANADAKIFAPDVARKPRRAFSHHARGQLFCDGSSRQIVDMLLRECQDAGAQLRLNTRISAVTKIPDGFAVATDQGVLHCGSLVVATGGPSIPKMGASGFGYKVAEGFGLRIVPPRAALVPLTFDAALLAQIKELAGVSVGAVVSCSQVRFAEGMLFTHRGLSGPSILQISSYWSEGEAITVDMAPAIDVLAWLKEARRAHPRQELATVLGGFLPKRLAQMIADMIAGPERIADFSDALLSAVVSAVTTWRVMPNGTEGYRTAEVTLGGVDTAELSSKTFEAKSVPGLYFVGEVVDVTGHLGGFNFQWAWSSGHAAGLHV